MLQCIIQSAPFTIVAVVHTVIGCTAVETLNLNAIHEALPRRVNNARDISSMNRSFHSDCRSYSNRDDSFDTRYEYPKD